VMTIDAPGERAGLEDAYDRHNAYAFVQCWCRTFVRGAVFAVTSRTELWGDGWQFVDVSGI